MISSSLENLRLRHIFIVRGDGEMFLSGFPSPLIFNDCGRRIEIKNVRALKDVFKKEFYPQLLVYLYNGRLESFLFGFRMSYVSQTIQQLRKSGNSDLEIINKIAELIGAEPISIDPSESLSEHPDLLKKLTETDQEILLANIGYFLKASRLELKGSKVFRKAWTGDTELLLGVSHLKGAGKLVFEDLSISIDDEVVFEGFEEVEFKNVFLKSNYPVKFVNTRLKLSGCRVRGCLQVENTSLSAENSEFSESDEGAIVSIKSSIVLQSCKIFENETYVESSAQLWLSDSEAKFIDCEIAKSSERGIFFKRSKVSLIKCKVYKNRSEGIYADEKSDLYIEDCSFYENGGKLLVQIYLEDGSRALIRNSRIHDSETAGLIVSNAEASVIECKIYKNKMHGILIEDKSKLKVEKCDIYGNSMSAYSQLYLENSTATIEDSQIHEAMEETAIGLFMTGSKVSVKGCEIYKNNAGISSIKKSKLSLENCSIYENETSLYMSGSRASVSGCKIYNSDKHGIYAEGKSQLIVQNCELQGNGKYEYTQIHIANSSAVLENLRIHNAEGNGVIVLDKAEVSIKNCHIYENRTTEYTHTDMEEYLPFADIEKYLTFGEDPQAEKPRKEEVANGIGLLVIDSKVSIVECSIYRNSQSGIFAQEGAEVSIEKCDIYENLSYERPQVAILSSTAVIKDSQIHDSEGGYGLSISGSNVSITGCEIYQNNANGVWAVEKSRLSIKDSAIYKNSGDESEHPQVYIEDSIAIIENSQIYDALNEQSNGVHVESGAALLYNVRTHGNRYGVYVYEGSVAVYECQIEDGINSF